MMLKQYDTYHTTNLVLIDSKGFISSPDGGFTLWLGIVWNVSIVVLTITKKKLFHYLAVRNINKLYFYKNLFPHGSRDGNVGWSVCLSQSVHHFSPDWNISTTIKRLAMKFYWSIHGSLDIFGFKWSVLTNIVWTAIKWGTDIHILLRMNFSNSGYPLTFDQVKILIFPIMTKYLQN